MLFDMAWIQRSLEVAHCVIFILISHILGKNTLPTPYHGDVAFTGRAPASCFPLFGCCRGRRWGHDASVDCYRCQLRPKQAANREESEPLQLLCSSAGRAACQGGIQAAPQCLVAGSPEEGESHPPSPWRWWRLVEWWRLGESSESGTRGEAAHGPGVGGK
jgi:hypothetical protein